MKLGKIGLHGFMLTLINLGSIIIGYIVYLFLVRHDHPIHIQIPVAVVLTSIGFLIWKMSVWLSGRISLMLHGLREYAAVYCAALLWTPVLFIPVHHYFTGYTAAPGNVVGIWAFQFWANAVAIAVVGWLVRWGKHAIEIAS